MNIVKLSLLLILATLLQGCSHGLLSDNRSISQQVRDDNLSLQTLDAINELKLYRKETRINIITNSGYILLIGQVKNRITKQKIDKKLALIKDVKGIYNELRIAKPISFAQQTEDSWITARVKTKLARERDVNTFEIKVITENNEVFLIGSVTKEVSDDATNITRKVSSVKQVNRVFQIVK